MFKIYLLAGVFSALSFHAQAQKNAQFESPNKVNDKTSSSESDRQFRVGVGLGTGDFAFGNAPFPFHVIGEKQFHNNISGGVYLSYATEKTVYYNFSTYRAGIRANYHFNELLNLENDNVDLYAGVMGGLRVSGGSEVATLLGTGVYTGFHVGGRYYFSDKLGAYAELGRAATWLKFGIITRF
ncbi:hypothetical protein [Persicitalea sp.]|uniref:hypothetical protein n=1 Tax=Persicitalea sp. TaxID=3100273 RepID=UPI0035936C6E